MEPVEPPVEPVGVAELVAVPPVIEAKSQNRVRNGQERRNGLQTYA